MAGAVPGKRTIGKGATGNAAGGKPKIGVKTPKGKVQPVMKGTTGKAAGGKGKTTAKVPGGKKGASY